MANSDQANAHNRPEPVSAKGNVLDQDIGCPGCGYNLRGLGSGVAACPECGLRSDIAKLLSRQWDKPWYLAPGYRRICMPAAWTLISMFVTVFAIGLGFEIGGMAGLYFAILIAGVPVLTWLLLMAWVWRAMGGLTGAAFALLAHASLGGYILAVLLIVGGVVAIIFQLTDNTMRRPGWLYNLMIAGVTLALGVGLFILCRWFERLVAGYCIRLYLRGPKPRG